MRDTRASVCLLRVRVKRWNAATILGNDTSLKAGLTTSPWQQQPRSVDLS